jgi:hypothetical protein
MIFVAIQESLSVMSLSPRLAALSLITTTAAAGELEVVDLGMEGSKEESSRMKTTKLISGCARGMKARVENLVDKKMDWTLRAG